HAAQEGRPGNDKIAEPAVLRRRGQPHLGGGDAAIFNDTAERGTVRCSASHDRSRAMKIGFCMFLWTTSIAKKHEPILEDIKATGYDGVEIPVFVGKVDDYRRLGDTLDRIGLERTAVSAIGDPAMSLISSEAATRKAGIDYMKWAIDCTKALGAHN